MSRVLALVLLIGSTGCAACGNGSKTAADPPKNTASGEEKIAVPGGDRGGAPQVTGAPNAQPASQQGLPDASDPRFHIKPEEGSITVDKAEAKAGSEATAKLALAPAKGYHVATDYPIKLFLEAPSGVKVSKSVMTAGGRSKDQGDAATFSEQALAFAIKATPEKAGSYEIKGVLKFGICEKESCHPKTQPITITVAAN